MPLRINSTRANPVRQPDHQAEARPTAPAEPRVRGGGAHQRAQMQVEQIRQLSNPPRRQQWPQQFSRLGLWQPAVRAWVMEHPLVEQDRREIYQRITRFQQYGHLPLGTTIPESRGLLNLSFMRLETIPPLLPPGFTRLDLTHNSLNHIPSNLPSGLEELKVKHNRLRDLPDTLPRQLHTLDASHNQLRTLPERLPRNLQTLNLSHNQLVDISPEAINCMARMGPSATVDLSANPLSPQTILRLEQLQNAPGYQGPQITYVTTRLELSCTSLDSVPDDLPSTVEELDLSINHLASLPNNLPRQLRTLNVSVNGLTTLPDRLPPGLAVLNASHNRLVDISPQAIHALAQMAPTATVDLRSNPLSAQTIDRLEQLQNSPDYQGPRITFDRSPSQARPAVPVAQPAAPARVHEQPIAIQSVADAVLARLDPEVAEALLHIQRTAVEAGHPISDADFINMALDQMQLNPAQANRQPAVPAAPAGQQPGPLTGLAAAVAVWGPEPPSNIAPSPRQWHQFSAEPNAAAFSNFLARLATTVNAHDPQFRNKVSEWLHHLETNPQLRSDTFAVSEGATASCGDRIYHAFNDMRQLRLASDVSNGDYDQRLPELLTLARGMFRLGQLETIARRHAASRPGVDEIEVYLGFQVMLRERLALPLDTANMHYPSMAEIRPEHLERAYNRVIVAERQGFADYLACDWRPWQAVLQRQRPEQYEQTQERLIDAMDEEFSTRLQARLRAEGLENDPDAQRTVGPLVQAEIAREINGPLTQDFLRSEGLLRHIR